jgi:hypothetical protein
MNEQSINSSSTNDLPRCQHRTPTGRRCRHAVSSIKAGFCSTHAPAHSNRSEQSDLSAYLTAGLTDFKSAVTISDFLSRLLHLQAEDRISPRRASVMAYTCNLLLRTPPAIEHELHPEEEDDVVRVEFGDLPRPPGSPRYREHAPPSHPDMSWLAPVSDTPGPKESP